MEPLTRTALEGVFGYWYWASMPTLRLRIPQPIKLPVPTNLPLPRPLAPSNPNIRLESMPAHILLTPGLNIELRLPLIPIKAAFGDILALRPPGDGRRDGCSRGSLVRRVRDIGAADEVGGRGARRRLR